MWRKLWTQIQEKKCKEKFSNCKKRYIFLPLNRFFQIFMKYFSSFSTIKILRTTLNVLFRRNITKTFSNSTYSEKCLIFEIGNHLLNRLNILQSYFGPAVHVSVSISESGLMCYIIRRMFINKSQRAFLGPSEFIC